MPVNDFLPFAVGAGANVESQAAYASDPSTAAGFSAGIAQSQKLNKVWRQSSFISAALAGFVGSALGEDVLDNGDLPAFSDQLRRALQTTYPRMVLQANQTFYVNGTLGSDTNGDGLTPATAWATPEYAAYFCTEKVDCNGWAITVQVADGTYQGFNLYSGLQGATTGLPLTFVGNVSTPGACVLAGPSSAAPNIPIGLAAGSYTISGIFGANCDFKGFRITNTSGNGGCLQSIFWSRMRFANCDFGPTPGFPQIVGDVWSRVRCMGNYTISAGANIHMLITGKSSAWISQDAVGVPLVVTLTGTPAFSQAFAWCSDGATISWGSGSGGSSPVQFVGAATGPRYFVNTHGLIAANGAGANFLPGNAAGTADATTFGLYI